MKFELCRALKFCVTPLILTACSTPLKAERGRENPALLREALDLLVSRRQTPGLQYILVGPDGILFEHCAGLADLASHTPVRPSTAFYTYSLTKTFTAAAILRLVDQGKVHLEDEVIRYVPESPYGSDLKIHHLLSQSSGIPHPIPLRWVHLAKNHESFDEKAALRKLLQKHPKLDFSPGEKYGYSNISYWLLGAVIEKASGQDYVDFMREQVFQPLGAQNQMAFSAKGLESAAKGYLPKWSWMNLLKAFVSDPSYWGAYEGSWLNIHEHLLNGPAFGGLITTARGVSRFLQDQLSEQPRILSPSLKREFLAVQRNNREEEIPMTLGWHVDQLNGGTYLYKEGGGMGFHAEMRLYPEHRVGSVLLVNSGSFNSRKILSQLDQLSLR